MPPFSSIKISGALPVEDDIRPTLTSKDDFWADGFWMVLASTLMLDCLFSSFFNELSALEQEAINKEHDKTVMNDDIFFFIK
ncbi:hypothetical protein [Moraxella lacunata]|uniref:hypothetical protein n=1 Tax=Moraxella lacunata TaxID=477 RepID=UPI003EDE87D4